MGGVSQRYTDLDYKEDVLYEKRHLIGLTLQQVRKQINSSSQKDKTFLTQVRRSSMESSAGLSRSKVYYEQFIAPELKKGWGRNNKINFKPMATEAG